MLDMATNLSHDIEYTLIYNAFNALSDYIIAAGQLLVDLGIGYWPNGVAPTRGVTIL